MLETSPTREICLAKVAHLLRSERYGRKVVSTYPIRVGRFLDYLERGGEIFKIPKMSSRVSKSKWTVVMY